MDNVRIRLAHRPGALATMGEVLGQAGHSIEGGGAFVVNGEGIANFLFADGEAVRHVLEAAGMDVLAVQPVLIQKLQQDVPGQLGALTRRMATAGVNIEILYSDHANQLILVVDNLERGQQVSAQWMQEQLTRS